MRILGRVRWNSPGHLGEREVEVAGLVRGSRSGRQKGRRQWRVPVGTSRCRLPPYPTPGGSTTPSTMQAPENKLAVAGLISACLRSECRQHATVSTIGANREFIKSELGECGSQFSNGGDSRIDPGHFPEGVVVQRQVARRETGPRDVVLRQPICPSGRAFESATVVDAVMSVNAFNQPLLDRLPVTPECCQRLHVNRHA